MDAMILGQDFETIAVLDAFESFIWTDRYYEAGDCEVYASASLDLVRNLTEGNYLWRRDTEHLMIVDSVTIDTAVETGVHITATGESLEALLKRRIIYPTTIEGNLQNGIQKLLNENVINPTNTKRKISNFVFISSKDPRITSIEIAGLQYCGENLYESIVELCMAYDMGFKVTLSDDYKFEFQLYMGQDRSYNQEDNPWVVFSPKFENLTSSNYYSSKKDYKNATYILGAELHESDEDLDIIETHNNGSNRYYELEYDDAIGLDRRETFTDASDIDDTYKEETYDSYEEEYVEVEKMMTDAEYQALLADEGELELSETATTTAFEGIIDATQQYVYGVDFTIGDVVQVVNEFDMTSNSRISEIIWCHDLNGISVTPTFINA